MKNNKDTEFLVSFIILNTLPVPCAKPFQFHGMKVIYVDPPLSSMCLVRSSTLPLVTDLTGFFFFQNSLRWLTI